MSIEYAKIFMQALDKELVPLLTSAPMELNQNMVKYNGGNEVKIPKIVLEGLADYNRSTGFDAGTVTLSYETHTLTQDRGKEFNLDAMDVDESNFVATAGNVVGEFQRVKVAPEIDAYRYSRIFAVANAGLKTEAYTPVDTTIFEQLSGNIADVQDVIGDAEPMTIYMSYAAANKLDLADKIEKKLEVGSFERGGVSLKVKSLDGIPIIRVPSTRFKSLFTFGSDGFTAAATAMNINWIISADRGLIAVNKQDKMRVFSPDVNQEMDAWKIQYRRYHDLFIPDNKVAALWVSYTAITAPTLTLTVAAGTAAGTKFSVTEAEGDYTITDAALTPKFNEVVAPDEDDYTENADIATATAGKFLNVFFLDANLRVMAFASEELAAGDIFV
jgi:hypothetical protein